MIAMIYSSLPDLSIDSMQFVGDNYLLMDCSPHSGAQAAQVSQEDSSCSHVIVLLQFFLSQYQFSTFPTNSGGNVSQITKLLPLEGSGPMLTFLTTASDQVLLLGLLLL